MDKKLARKIVISADSYEARAALLDGDLLINLEIESAGSNRKKGNIYRGRVTTIEKGLDAAFVDYGTGKEGFLPLDEVNERSLIELTGKSPAASGHVSLGVGDVILVQVAKEEVGKKGAALTMNVSNPGRFLVLMPFSSRTGVSRRLAGDDRTRLKDALDRLSLPEGFGCIIRTVSDQSMDNELQADLDHLLNQWRDMTARFRELKKPGEVHTESSLALRFIRDYMDTGVGEVIVEDDVTWREMNQYFSSVMPGCLSVLSRYNGDLPLFVKYNVDRQVEALLKNKVTLPSGGSIVIGQTEALTAIDVNSGRTKKGAIEDTAFRTNLEAAVEIARQVILRDIGGIIVVDFIDMESEAHRKGVEDALRSALARDKAHLTVARIRDFGLLAFSRQRLRHTVEEGIMSACPTCGGTGRIRAPGPLAMSIMRRLRERLANMTSEAELVEVTVSVDVANFLNNRKRDELIGLEKKHGLAIEILGATDVAADDMQVRIHEAIPDDRQLSRVRIDVGEETAPVPATQPATQLGTDAGRAQAAPAAPPKQKPSLLKGLLARLLDLDEYEEVPAKAPARAPVSEPALAAMNRGAKAGEQAAAAQPQQEQPKSRPPRQPRQPRQPREPRQPRDQQPQQAQAAQAQQPRDQQPRQQPKQVDKVPPAPAPAQIGEDGLPVPEQAKPKRSRRHRSRGKGTGQPQGQSQGQPPAGTAQGQDQQPVQTPAAPRQEKAQPARQQRAEAHHDRQPTGDSAQPQIQAQPQAPAQTQDAQPAGDKPRTPRKRYRSRKPKAAPGPVENSQK